MKLDNLPLNKAGTDTFLDEAQQLFSHVGLDKANIHMFSHGDGAILNVFGRLAINTPDTKVVRVTNELGDWSFVTPKEDISEKVEKEALEQRERRINSLNQSIPRLRVSGLGLCLLFLENKIQQSHILNITENISKSLGSWSARDGTHSINITHHGWFLSDSLEIGNQPWELEVSSKLKGTDIQCRIF